MDNILALIIILVVGYFLLNSFGIDISSVFYAVSYRVKMLGDSNMSTMIAIAIIIGVIFLFNRKK